MLRRIVSNVSKKASTEYIAPTAEVLEQASRELDELSQNQVAVLKIKPNTEAWFHFEMDLAANTIAGKVEIHYHDIYVLAEEIREYADQIQVVKPEALAQLVRAGFERVANQHG
jgi:proteasome accessory factor B